MKRDSLLTLLLLLIFSIGLTSCGDDDETSPQDIAAEEFEGSWRVQNISLNAEDVTADYPGMTMRFGAQGTYGTTNSDELFLDSGIWIWANESTTTVIIFDDGKEITFVEVSESRLVMTFFIPNEPESADIAGNYRIAWERL